MHTVPLEKHRIVTVCKKKIIRLQIENSKLTDPLELQLILSDDMQLCVTGRYLLRLATRSANTCLGPVVPFNGLSQFVEICEKPSVKYLALKKKKNEKRKGDSAAMRCK